MGVKETAYEAFAAWTNFSPVELVTAAVGALDRFLLGMVCLVFGLGAFELFLARSNREGEVRDERLRKLSWLTVTSVDDLEQKVGEIIVAVMVVNLVRERRRERRVRAASARRRALEGALEGVFRRSSRAVLSLAPRRRVPSFFFLRARPSHTAVSSPAPLAPRRAA